VTIPCAIDLDRFSNADRQGLILRESLGMTPDQPMVLWVGRLVPIKGCEIFLHACAIVAKYDERVRFFMIGDGPLRDSLRALASELGLTGRLEITGEWTDIVPWMGASDIYVLSSLNEGLGRVLLEAMATRNPLVATDVGGVGEIVVPDETGFLVPPENPERLADGILTLLMDPVRSRAMGEKGFRRSKSFDLQQMTAHTAALYEELLREKGHLCAIME